MVRFPSGITLLAALFLCWNNPANAGPRTKRGVCGSVLPTSSKLIGKQRYSLWYPKTMYSLLKFYRKVFGSRNPSYKVTKLFALPKVVAYHLQNLCKQCTTTTVRNDTYYPMHYCQHCRRGC